LILGTLGSKRVKRLSEVQFSTKWKWVMEIDNEEMALTFAVCPCEALRALASVIIMVNDTW